MTLTPTPPAEAEGRLHTGIRFSICTLLTRPEQYEGMLASFRERGFGVEDCEFLTIDNTSGNRHDGYEGCNIFLSVARGDYIIICHQDIVLIDDRAALESALAGLDLLDPHWAACGNAGGVSPGRLARRISDPFGADQRTAGLPTRVQTLDENFILVRRSANLALSRDLSGFHLYGTDLCLIADILGWSSYVIDFHIRHLSAGTRDETLSRARANLLAKYSNAFRDRWVMSSCSLVYLSGVKVLSRLMSSPLPTRLLSGVGRRTPDT